MQECVFQTTFLEKTYQCFYIKNQSLALEAVSRLMQKDILFAIDSETEPLSEFAHIPKAGLNPYLSRTRLVQICDGENSFIFDMHTLTPFIFKDFLSTKRFVAHYALFDLQYFIKDFEVDNMNIGCTHIMAKLLHHALYPTDAGFSAGLANLCESLLGTSVLKKLQVSDWSIDDLTFEQVEYAAIDAIAVLKLTERLVKGFQRYDLDRIYQLTKAAQHPIAQMQLNGMKLDVEAHKKLISTWRVDLIESLEAVQKLTGIEKLTPTNIEAYLDANLSPEIKAIWPLTEMGKMKLDSDAFAAFDFLPIVEPLARYKKLDKLTSTYGMKLLHSVNPVTGRVHSHYNLCGARTGRLSSNDVNFQNLPARDTSVRKNFVPEYGSVFLCADYGQIEIRVMAELSRDKEMLRAFEEGLDIHTLTGSKISGRSYEEVAKDKPARQLSKALTFGLAFGIGVKKFAHYARKNYKVDIDAEEAAESIKAWRTLYSGYHTWQMEKAEEAAITCSSVSPCGKIRAILEEKTYSVGMNSEVQSGAAECMLYALTFLHKNLPPWAIIVNCVHDEILVESIYEGADEVQKIINDSMTAGFLAVFPGACTRGLVDCKSGNSWAEAK